MALENYVSFWRHSTSVPRNLIHVRKPFFFVFISIFLFFSGFDNIKTINQGHRYIIILNSWFFFLFSFRFLLFFFTIFFLSLSLISFYPSSQTLSFSLLFLSNPRKTIKKIIIDSDGNQERNNRSSAADLWYIHTLRSVKEKKEREREDENKKNKM